MEYLDYMSDASVPLSLRLAVSNAALCWASALTYAQVCTAALPPDPSEAQREQCQEARAYARELEAIVRLRAQDLADHICPDDQIPF